MPQALPVDKAIGEALEFSRRLENRRGDIHDFEVRRLAQLADPKGGNRLTYLLKEALVAEIERDFQRFDTATEKISAEFGGEELLMNLAPIALFAFNPEITLRLVRRVIPMIAGQADALEFLMPSVWYAGDLGLCTEIRSRITGLGGEMEKIFSDREAVQILDAAGVSLEEYRNYIAGFHDISRHYLHGKRNKKVILDIDAVCHEDGHEMILFQILSNLDDEDLDSLDEKLMDRQSNPEQVSENLASVVSYLVRDLPTGLRAEAC